MMGGPYGKLFCSSGTIISADICANISADISADMSADISAICGHEVPQKQGRFQEQAQEGPRKVPGGTFFTSV